MSTSQSWTVGLGSSPSKSVSVAFSRCGLECSSSTVWGLPVSPLPSSCEICIASTCCLKATCPCTSTYRQLGGFFIHAWFVALLDRALISQLSNPVTWAIKANVPLGTKVCLKRFDHLVPVWRRWRSILAAGSGTSFLAALPGAPPPAVLPPCLDLWFDARAEGDLVVVGAFCHGVAARLQLPSCFSIPHAEAFAVPIGMYMLEASLPDLSLASAQLHSDALATALNLASGKPRAPIMLQAHAETVQCTPIRRLCVRHTVPWHGQPSWGCCKSYRSGCSTVSACNVFVRPSAFPFVGWTQCLKQSRIW